MPEGEWPIAFSASSAFGLVRSQSDHRLFLQKKQSPQEIVNGTTTRSPIFSLVFADPTSTTSPMNSWPSTSPDFMVGMKPSYRCRSEPQIAVLVTLTIASRGSSIRGSGTLSTLTFSLPCQQSALICPPMPDDRRQLTGTGRSPRSN